ncbi:MAG TPA: SDR family NAD(P)-dependent oxidoreductase [Streptosporangiaceae bacterium]
MLANALVGLADTPHPPEAHTKRGSSSPSLSPASLRVLVTGGTGSFGSAFVRRVVGLGWTVRVFSRDEVKQGVMRDEFDDAAGVRFLVGDVRDRSRLARAVEGCDLVVHAAALKQVVSCEYNPFEAVKTNVVGSQNVVEACLDAGVPRAILLSSDKAVHPVNVYGASKLCAEKCWLAANVYAGGRDVRFSAVRYGNVRGSRGSVLEKASLGPVPVTDGRATRFWMDVADAVDVVLLALREMHGGEVFVPKLRSARLSDVLGEARPEIGLRRGEKLHEMLISDEEVSRTWDCGDHFRVCEYQPANALRVPGSFRYCSEVTAA